MAMLQLFKLFFTKHVRYSPQVPDVHGLSDRFPPTHCPPPYLRSARRRSAEYRQCSGHLRWLTSCHALSCQGSINRLDMAAVYELIATFRAPFYRARHVMDMPTAVLDITVVAAFPFVVQGGVSCVDHVVDAYRIHGTRVG